MRSDSGRRNCHLLLVRLQSWTSQAAPWRAPNAFPKRTAPTYCNPSKSRLSQEMAMQGIDAWQAPRNQSEDAVTTLQKNPENGGEVVRHVVKKKPASLRLGGTVVKHRRRSRYRIPIINIYKERKKKSQKGRRVSRDVCSASAPRSVKCGNDRSQNDMRACQQ